MRPPSLPGREGAHVRRAVETPRRHPPRELVLAVAVPRIPGEAGENDHRPLPPDDLHDVGSRRLLVPRPERLLEILRVAVIGERRVVDPVEPVPVPGNLQFGGPDQAEPVEQLRPDGVRPRFTPGDAQERGPDAVPPAEERQKRPVLVVGVRSDMEHRSRGLELLNPVPGRCRPSLPRPGGLRDRGADERKDQQRGCENAPTPERLHGAQV